MRELWVKQRILRHTSGMRRTALLLLLLCGGVSFLWSSYIASSGGGLGDFKAYYYGSRCLLEHRDAYQQAAFLDVYRRDGGRFSSDPVKAHAQRRAIPICINLPSALFLIAPLALLPFKAAEVCWMIFEFTGLILAAYLTWDLTCFVTGVETSRMPLVLLCILAANCEVLFSLGNVAGVVVSLCVIAVWCFFKNRFVLAGVVCLAVSLALKPHDAGLIWLYLPFAGARLRRPALQILVVTCVLCIPAVLWVSHIAPHWLPELHSNLLTTSAHGDINDPGPASLSGHSASAILDLQTILSLFLPNPHIYNPVTYLICGTLVLTVLIAAPVTARVTATRSRFSCQRASIAIAAIVPLTMLVTYHRPYDAKLLMLTIPACALLWNEGGAIGWVALSLTAAAVVLTGDLPLAVLTLLTRDLPNVPHGSSAVLLSLLLLHPGTLVLLAMGVFYLCVTVPSEDLPSIQSLDCRDHTARGLMRGVCQRRGRG